MVQRQRVIAAGLVLALAGGVPAAAQDLVYRPINPSFGGNSLNSQHLLGIASAQRTATARDADDGSSRPTTPGTTSPGSTNADLFVRQLQGRLLSALASQVTDSIFGTDPQESGTVTFGTTTVTFERTLESIRLEIADNLEGTVTEIVVPQLVTGTEVN